MKCFSCKNDIVKEDKTTYFTTLENCYVIIENVPCKKCTQCGEIFFSQSVMERIDYLLHEVEKVSSKLTIMDYQEAA